jgi:hypothetical protein
VTKFHTHTKQTLRNNCALTCEQYLSSAVTYKKVVRYSLIYHIERLREGKQFGVLRIFSE